MADRPRDRIEVDDLLFTLRELDVGYLRTWAADIDVAARLNEAFYMNYILSLGFGSNLAR